MKGQHLTYYSLRWSGRVLEESTSSTSKGIDPPTPWVFPACAAIPVQSLWTPLSLSCSSNGAPEQTCPGSSISFSHWALWCGFSAAVHIIRVWRFSFHNTAGLKFHILQVLQCDNLGAGYALYIFHKRTPSPESEMWKKSALQGIYWQKLFLRLLGVGRKHSCYLEHFKISSTSPLRRG